MPPFREHPLARLDRLQTAAANATSDELALVKAARRGDAAGVRKLLDKGVDPDAIATVDGAATTALWAAVDANRPAVVELLGKAGADLNDGMSRPAALHAANRGDLPMLRALAAGGADLNSPDDLGETPLSHAIWHGKQEIFGELLRLGADVTARLKGGSTAARTPLQLAFFAGRQGMVEALLKAGATDDGLEALLLTNAAARGDVKELRRRLDDGQKVDTKDPLGRTPLVSAAAEGKAAAAKFLLARGAKPDLRSGGRYGGQSPLTAALFNRRANVVRLLLAAGADASKADAGGVSPLTIAKQMRMQKAVDALQAAADAAGRPRGPEFRGVPTFDVNDACVLVESAGVDAVAGALKQLKRLKAHTPDVFGRTIRISNRCYAVVRFHGVPWAAVVRVRCDVNDYPSADLARGLAKRLKTRAIYFGNSDTGGVAQYGLFDATGRLEECFDYGSTEPRRGRRANLASLARAFAVGPADLPPVKVGKYHAFGSRSRKVDPDAIDNDMSFINAFFRSVDALAPFYPEGFEVPGNKARFEFLDFAKEDVERMDYVG